MAFWIAAGGISALVVLLLLLALRRGTDVADAGDDGTRETREIKVYSAQLREIEKDLARGVIAADEAERLKLEVKRRILEADRSATRHTVRSVAAPVPARVLAFMVMAVLVPMAGATYLAVGAPGYPDMPLAQRIADAAERRANRMGQAEAETRFAEIMGAQQPQADPDHMALIEQLRAALANRPLDLQGHILLAENEARLGNHAAAHVAQSRVIELKESAASSDDFAWAADLMVLAAGGYVSPEAEAMLEQSLRRNPANGTALYYTGLMFAQNGRPDLAFSIWRRLHDESAPEAPWMPVIRAQLEDLAQLAGVRYTLPPAGTARGPAAADIAAAAEMDEADREAMIGAMVQGLSQRLAAEGGPPEDWARLIAAYGVLGEHERARAIWEEAQVVFGANPQALEVIGAAASGAAPGEMD